MEQFIMQKWHSVLIVAAAVAIVIAGVHYMPKFFTPKTPKTPGTPAA